MREFLSTNQVELAITVVGLALCWLAILLPMLMA